MRALIPTLCLIWLLPVVASPGAAQTGEALPAAERAAIVDVIQRQIDAFRRDAAAEAFGYASPTVQDLFGNPANFMDMVRSGYRPVYRPQSVAFGESLVTPRGPIQRVMLVGPDGRLVMATYFMQRQPDGTWRIDGVTLDEAPGLSA